MRSRQQPRTASCVLSPTTASAFCAKPSQGWSVPEGAPSRRQRAAATRPFGSGIIPAYRVEGPLPPSSTRRLALLRCARLSPCNPFASFSFPRQPAGPLETSPPLKLGILFFGRERHPWWNGESRARLASPSSKRELFFLDAPLPEPLPSHRSPPPKSLA